MSDPAPGALRPARVRHRVVGMVVLLGMVTYLDRVCISTVAPNVMADGVRLVRRAGPGVGRGLVRVVSQRARGTSRGECSRAEFDRGHPRAGRLSRRLGILEEAAAQPQC